VRLLREFAFFAYRYHGSARPPPRQIDRRAPNRPQPARPGRRPRRNHQTAPTIDDRVRRDLAATVAAAARAGELVALRVPDPTRDEEIRLAHEVAVLRDELAEARGEDADERIERHRLAHLLNSTEEFYDDEGRLRTRPASAHGAADGSQLSKYSGGMVEMSCPADDVNDWVEPASPDAAEFTAEFVAMLGT
jgi:hypothetical protein